MEDEVVDIKGSDVTNMSYCGGCLNLDNFEPADYFKYYKRCEEYGDDKLYPYCHGKEVLVDYTLSDWHSSVLKKRLRYVVTKDLWRPSEAERKLYQQHCQCDKCRTSYFNPLRYLGFSHHTGCMKDNNGDLLSIDNVNVRGRTREHLQKKGLL